MRASVFIYYYKMWLCSRVNIRDGEIKMKTFNTALSAIIIHTANMSCDACACAIRKWGDHVSWCATTNHDSHSIAFYMSVGVEWKSLYKWNFTSNRMQKISSNIFFDVYCCQLFPFHISTDWFQYSLFQMGAKWKLFGKHDECIFIFWCHRCLSHWNVIQEVPSNGDGET